MAEPVGGPSLSTISVLLLGAVAWDSLRDDPALRSDRAPRKGEVPLVNMVFRKRKA
jgi:hypothetical protein